MRVEPAVRVHTGIQQQTDVVGMRQHTVDERPRQLAQLLLALGIPEQILAFLADRDVGVHAVAVDTDHRLGQERGGESHARRHLPADQLVELDLVGGRDDLAIGVIDLELRRGDLRVVLFVLEPHGALDFSGRVDEGPQWIAGERMVVAARIDVLECPESRDSAARRPLP